MRILTIEQLKPGFVLGKTLMDESGVVLLHKGIKLSAEYIDSLKAKGYRHLYVREGEDKTGVEMDEDLSQEVRVKAFATLKDAFDKIGDELASVKSASESDISNVFDSDRVRALMSEKGPLSKVPKLVSGIMDEVLNRTTLAGLTSIKNGDTQLYDHSIDTCVVALMIGRAIGLPTDKMRQLATGSLLHDVGKLFVAPGSDRERNIRMHTTAGYELLRRSENSEILAPYVAYEHHERQDGTGLPRGLRGSNGVRRNRAVATPIPTLVGEIAAVANAYDNLISGTWTGQPCTVDEALAEITRETGTRYNREVVMAFRRVVPVYPKGTEVVLHGDPFNGFLAVVCEVSPKRLNRPKVMLLKDAGRNWVEADTVDLVEFPAVTLKAMGL